MAVYQVQSNGIAPKGLVPGDYVNTGGGVYMIAAPGQLGSVYNPQSGYWSIKADSQAALRTPASNQAILSSGKAVADANTQTSQGFAREQMAFQQEANAQAMAFSAQQAQLNRDFQERMSNTAHQREVLDLVHAGLNPVLSANLSGASTPSGASAAGITSQGAQGTVDQSFSNLVGVLASQLINAETSLDIAKLQSATSMYMADRGYAGTTGAAGINAASNWRLQQSQQQHDEYMSAMYPSTMWQFLSSAMNAGRHLVSGDNSSSASNNAFVNMTYSLIDAFKNVVMFGDKAASAVLNGFNKGLQKDR